MESYRKLSRRGFLSGVTATAAASYLPLSPATRPGFQDESDLHIAVNGDLRGHLIGTVSKDSGKTPVVGAKVEVKGTRPTGSWTEEATTDEQGFFRSNLALGSNGAIDLTATKGNLQAKVTVLGSDLPQRLTPRPDSQGDFRISLDGDWDFAVDPPPEFPPHGSVSAWRTIKTPSNWEMEGFVAESGLAVFRKHFFLPPSWTHKRIKLRAEAIYSEATVWLNGKRAGAHDGGATTFEIDLTEAAQPGKNNELIILVHARSSTTDLDKISFYSYWNIAGIWRPLEIFCVEPVHVSRVAVTADFAVE